MHKVAKQFTPSVSFCLSTLENPNINFFNKIKGNIKEVIKTVLIGFFEAENDFGHPQMKQWINKMQIGFIFN